MGFATEGNLYDMSHQGSKQRLFEIFNQIHLSPHYLNFKAIMPVLFLYNSPSLHRWEPAFHKAAFLNSSLHNHPNLLKVFPQPNQPEFAVQPPQAIPVVVPPGTALPSQPTHQDEPKDGVKTDADVAEPITNANLTTNETLPSTTTPVIPIILPAVDKNVDLDNDGVLSLTEVQYAAFVHHGLSSSVVEALFNQVDKNRDGYLTSLEFNEIKALVLAKAENAALRYLQNVDMDKNQLLSLSEAQTYILKEYGISNRDVERIWRLVVPSSSDEMDAVLFSKLRRRVRGMSIRLARQIMKTSDLNEDGRIDLREAQAIAFEQEGIGTGDVIEMLASVDDNADGELNAPEFADFERIVRARAVDTAKKALKVVDTDGSGTLTMDEARKIAFDHYGFDERTLEPFFAQADENEDGQLDAIEFAGFRSVIRSRAVKNAQSALPEYDTDKDDDLDARETLSLFNVADQDRSNYLDKVELADFIRLVRLSAIKYINDHFKDFDSNRDKIVSVDELEKIVQEKYNIDPSVTRHIFQKVDIDRTNDLIAGEIVDFRHEIRKYVADRDAQDELDAQNKKELAEIEASKHRDEAPAPTETTTTEKSPEPTEKPAETKTESVPEPTSKPVETSALKTVKKQKESDEKPKQPESETTTAAPAESTQAKKEEPKQEMPADDSEFETVEVVEVVTDAPSTTTPAPRTRIVKVRRPKVKTTTPIPTTTQPPEEFEEVTEIVVDSA
ncbi:Calcium-dependent protein kinase 1 [Aphelenchoides bicaudatus]|nr:Calcium-dependent protein kinase 1 [Aphelenchoides bicaudatus]